jgi:hypothetical protein
MNYEYTYTISATLNPAERRDISVTTDNDSSFIVEKLIAYYDFPFQALGRDTAMTLNWSNVAIRSENMFGTAQFPNRIGTPIVLPPSTTVTFDTQSLELLLPNYVQIALEGYRYYGPMARQTRRYYMNAINFKVPASNVIDTTINISSMGDFMVEKLVRYADGQAETRMSASGLSGRQLSSGLVRLDNMFGNALNPNILKHPYKLVANSIIQAYVMNKEAFDNTVQLCFEGNVDLTGGGSGSGANSDVL